MPEPITSEDLNRMLDSYDQNPRAVTESVRSLLKMSPATFGDLTIQVLMTRESDVGLRPLAMVATGDDSFLLRFCEPRAMPRMDAVGVIRRLLEFNPLTDLRLFTLSRELDRDDSTEWVLDTLDAVSPGAKLVPMVTQLLGNPNPRVQSKAAAFIGKRTQNLAWVRRRLQEGGNSRVRANAVEALYGLETPEAREVLWEAANDPDNRVVGNALLGLYRISDPKVIPHIMEMAAHPDARFRRTALWVIARTAAPRFGELLLSMMRDPEPQVRSDALRAMQQLKQCIARAQAGSKLELRVLHTFQQGRERNLTVALRDQRGQPVWDVPATAFVLREGGRHMSDFTVEADWTHDPLHIAFLTDSVWGESDENYRAAVAGLEQAIEQKRLGDLWALVRIRCDARSLDNVAEVPVVFQASRQSLARTLAQPPTAISQPLAQAIPALLERMVATTGSYRGRRHVVAMLAADDGFLDDAAMLVRLAQQCRVAVHIIALGESALAPGLENVTSATGGMLLRAASAAELPQIFGALTTALVCRYIIRWENDSPPDTLALRVYLEDAWGEASTGSTVSESIPPSNDSERVPVSAA